MSLPWSNKREAMSPEELERRADYQEMFGVNAGPGRERVFGDLFRFCGMGESSFDPDPYTTARNEGRREVFLHIWMMSYADELAKKMASITNLLEREEIDE